MDKNVEPEVVLTEPQPCPSCNKEKIFFYIDDKCVNCTLEADLQELEESLTEERKANFWFFVRCVFIWSIIVAFILFMLYSQDQERALQEFESRKQAISATAYVLALDQCIESRPDDGAAQQECFKEIPKGHFDDLTERYFQ